MKNLIYLISIFTILSATAFSKTSKKDKTQAFLGVKEGGEWKWVTKNNGNEQYEYQGGLFKPAQSLKVDEKHTDHSFDLQFEGPGWESDKIAYRLYLDWRNAIDIFGKKTDTLVLHNVGADGFDSYHEVSDWGVDVLKVGSSLGIGSLAFWEGEKATRVEKTDSIYCEVESGKKVSKVIVDYYGWQINDVKTNLSTTLEIEAGSYLTKYSVKMTEDLPNLATGIVKHANTQIEVIEDIKPGWSCIVSFGKQTLQDDMLGMCIVWKNENKLQVTEDKYSHVVVLKPDDKELTYYFGAAWQQDVSGVSTMEDFKNLIKVQTKYLK